jgi:hypothetical protein
MAVLIELDGRIDGEHDVALERASTLGPVVWKTVDVNDDRVVLQLG